MSVSVMPVSPRQMPVAHRSSHTSLSCPNVVAPVSTSPRSGHIDAIVVPASRGAVALDGAVNLAARLGTTLVALCSQQTVGHEVAARFNRSRCHILVIDLPGSYRHALMPARTVADRFRIAAGDRNTDLSLKRNIGLLLARLHDWGKILFLDDDIGEFVNGRPAGLPVHTVSRLVAALDAHQIAGLACRDFPDNSVVCHARRLAGFDQGTFVSGAALAVNCNDHPLPFFPDQYNEDWFFFSRRVAAREIALAGYATQASYDPFETPGRARHEEFGDLLAEGLFALFQHQSAEMDYVRRLAAADSRYWDQFMGARRGIMSLASMELEIALATGSGNADRMRAALRSLDAAADQLTRLSPELCVDYLDAWVDDLIAWERATQRICSVRSTAEAMDYLGLHQWGSLGGRAVAREAAWT